MLGRTPDRDATDEALSAMAHPFRRRVLFGLYERTIRGDDARVDYGEVNVFSDETARLQLYHSHLPTLEAHGYIEWDEAETTVRKGPRWDHIEPLLKLLYTHLNELPPLFRGTRPCGDGTSS